MIRLACDQWRLKLKIANDIDNNNIKTLWVKNAQNSLIYYKERLKKEHRKLYVRFKYENDGTSPMFYPYLSLCFATLLKLYLHGFAGIIIYIAKRSRMFFDWVVCSSESSDLYLSRSIKSKYDFKNKHNYLNEMLKHVTCIFIMSC